MAQALFAYSPAVSATRRPLFSMTTLSRFMAIARQRSQLARLDTARLADVGLNAAQARSEAQRPFWDAPRHWK